MGMVKIQQEKKEERKKGVTQSLIFVRDYYAAFPTDGSITQCCIRPSLRLLWLPAILCAIISASNVLVLEFFISVSSWDAGVSDYSILDNVMFLI